MSRAAAMERASSSMPAAAEVPAGVLRRALLGAALVLGAIAWAYWPVLSGLVREWWNNEDYSVGGLVPLIAAYLLWADRRKLAQLPVRPAWLSGLAALLAVQGLWVYGFLHVYESIERYALLLTAMAALLLICGWRVTLHLKWVLLFGLLMIPPPGRIQNLISAPLQDVATVGAVMALELIGMTVDREGHVIVLNEDTRLAVAEACSGLRMLTAFMVVAATLAFLVERPAWQRTVVVLSSVPVAILCNLIRLVVTALLFVLVGSGVAEKFFHDFAGVLMMPLAVAILMCELWILKQLVLAEHEPPAASASGASQRRRART